VRTLKRKIRSLTRKLSQTVYGRMLIRLNQVQRGWAYYFQHAVAKHTFSWFRASPGNGSRTWSGAATG
jgi:RNA-directed DNA polymerase